MSAVTNPLTFDEEFNSLSLNNGSGGTWSSAYGWAPNGRTSGDTSSWLVNPNWGPTSGGDANVFSNNGGALSIGIKPTPGSVSGSVSGRPYLSGELTTIGSFAQTYGYFEMNAKLSNAPGAINAFWLLPADGSWPPELDGMEVLGNNPSTLVMTTHSNTNGTSPYWANIPDSSQGFHTYGVDWEPDKVTWYFDGKAVQQSATPADMNKPMYMVLSTQTGTSSSWAGAPNAGQTSSMDVDWVRVHSSDPNARGVASSSSASSAPAAAAPASAPASTGNATFNFSLSEDAWQGDAQFQVAIDGQTIGNPQSVTALHSNGASQDFSFSQALTAGTHDVAISFLNDAYGGMPNTDKNLYVNGISVNNTPVSGAAAAIYSAGTQHFSVNIPV
jgi:beta-glucanase (GH16 family)